MKKIELKDFPELVEAIESILNNGGIVELKNESFHQDRVNLTVVEIRRVLRKK